MAKLKRRNFGQSSEKLTAEIQQLELVLGDLEESEAQDEARSEASAPPNRDKAAKDAARGSGRGNREPLPEHLPREIVNHAGACVCPACGSQNLRKVNDETREVLEYVPSHFKVVVHVRPVMSCRDCEAVSIRRRISPSGPVFSRPTPIAATASSMRQIASPARFCRPAAGATRGGRSSSSPISKRPLGARPRVRSP